jgi:DNA (cytosine-5)-methyltransferase 1
MRQRLIFVGVRRDLAEDFDVAPRFPRPLPTVLPLAAACPDVVRVEARGYGHYHVLDDATTMPARTIAASGYSSVGGYELVCRDGARRQFTLDELKAVCGFPPDYVLTGSYSEGWTRLGNSVPPLMMRVVAEVVRDEILAKIG